MSAQERRHLLVVDDDPEIQLLATHYFSSQGFEVSSAGDAVRMRELLRHEPIDLVLLDLGLPGEDGLEVMRSLRSYWHGAVIILTGRDEANDRVVGLELGADDYVTKPFELRELLARVRSVLRRTTASPQASHCIEFDRFRLDLHSRQLRDVHGEEVALTAGEFELLRAFLEQPNRVLSRDELMSRLHGREAGPFDRAIDMQVGRLRRKIEPDPGQPRLIKSVRGAGYLFAGKPR